MDGGREGGRERESDPSRSHQATDLKVRLTEASSGKATAAATPMREDGTCDGAKGLLVHEELMKLRQENEDLRAQLRRERRGHLTERPRTAGGDRGSRRGGGGFEVDGFEVLGMRYKKVWGTTSHTMAPGRSSKRTRAEDGDSDGQFCDDCDGDFQACKEPNASGVAAPRPTHAYFTRTASAEMTARMDGMGF